MVSSHIRLFISELPNITEEDGGVEVPFDVCLLERNDLTTEKVFNTESACARNGGEAF
jgi:hypothetical protein